MIEDFLSARYLALFAYLFNESSASGAEEPGNPHEKWATGTRYAWTRVENLELECYYTSNRQDAIRARKVLPEGHIADVISGGTPCVDHEKMPLRKSST